MEVRGQFGTITYVYDFWEFVNNIPRLNLYSVVISENVYLCYKMLFSAFASMLFSPSEFWSYINNSNKLITKS